MLVSGIVIEIKTLLVDQILDTFMRHPVGGMSCDLAKAITCINHDLLLISLN
jgi:hypothetical protein